MKKYAFICFCLLQIRYGYTQSCLDSITAIREAGGLDYAKIITDISSFLIRNNNSIDSLCLGKAYQTIANRYENLRYYDSAIVYTKRAFTIRQSIQDCIGLIQSAGSMYYQCKAFGNPYLAVPYLNQVVNLDLKEEYNVRILEFLADIYSGRGEHEMAGMYYQQMELACSVRSDSIYATYAKSQQLFVKIKSEILLGKSEISEIQKIPDWYTNIGFSNPNFIILDQGNKPEQLFRAYDNTIRLKRFAKDWNGIVRDCNKLLQEISALGDVDPFVYSRIYIHLQDAHYNLKQYEQCKKNSDAALAVLVKAQHPIILNTYMPYYAQTRMYIKQKQFDKAEQTLFNSLYAIDPLFASNCPNKPVDIQIIKQAAQNSYILYFLHQAADFHYQRSKQFKSTEDLEHSLKYFEIADQAIDYYNSILLTSNTKLSWREVASEIYSDAIQLAETTNNKELAFYYLEKSKALIILEELHNKMLFNQIQADEKEQLLAYKSAVSQLKKQFETEENLLEKINIGDQQIKALQYLNAYKHYLLEKYKSRIEISNNTIDIPTLRTSLNNNQQLLAYFKTQDTLFVFTVTSKQFDIHKKAIPSNFDSLILQERLTISRKQDNKNEDTELVNYLIPTLDQSIKELIIIPIGTLWYLPFESLLLPSTNTFLVEQLTVQYQFSATFRDFVSQFKYADGLVNAFSPTFMNKSSDNQLVTRDVYRDADTMDLEPLIHVDEELEKLQAYYTSKRHLDATAKTFYTTAAGSSVVHIASHAFSDPSIANASYVVIARENQSNVYYKLFAEEIIDHQIPAQLIVLSACETGIGKLTQSEGLLSLARAFTLSGSGSVVSSMWRVNDATTSKLMFYFYKHLKGNKSKSKALAHAKREFIQNHPEYKNPYYWAPFVLIGDDRPIIQNLSLLEKLKHYFS